MLGRFSESIHPQLHIMFDLAGEHFEPKLVLKVEDTPGLSWLDLLPTHPKQEQISHNGDAKGLFDAILLSGDLMLSQAQTRFEFPDEQFSLPFTMHP